MKEFGRDVIYILLSILVISVLGSFLLIQRISFGEIAFIALPGILIVPLLDMLFLKKGVARLKRLAMSVIAWIVVEGVVLFILGQSLSKTGY